MSDYTPLMEALRTLKAQSDSGFEGLIRDCLETLSGRTLRLVKSGPQGGKDILSEGEASLPVIAIESKRFSAKTHLPLDELVAKLKEALQTTPEIDIWGLVLSREMKEPDWGELRSIGAEHGVTLICMDWRDAPGTLPVIAAICCAGRHIAEARLGDDLARVFDKIEAHPDYHRLTQDLRRKLTGPETGFDLARRRAHEWLKTTVSSAPSSRQVLRSHADILGADAHCVSRPEIEHKIDQWWQSGARSPAVLLGDEGRGKTWAALKWCLDTLARPDAPLTIVTSAKDIRSEDAGEILAAALSRCFPALKPSQLQQRVRRWVRSDHATHILFVVDGLNERWSVSWNEFVKLFEVAPWKNRVSLLLTSRSGYWQDDLQRLRGATDEPIAEISVPQFSDPELDQYLATYGLKRAQLPSALLKLIRVPRFARLAITLKDKLGDAEDLTEARLVLEDWRSRLEQRDLHLDDESLLQFVANLGKDLLQDAGFSISAKEIHARLSADSGRDLDHYRAAINEIVEGSWLQRGDKPYRYQVNKALLPYVIGLDLSRVIEDTRDRVEADDIVAKYEEQLRGADIGVAILRAATSISFARQRATKVALEALLEAWIKSQNFGPVDFGEMWPLVSREPELFLDVAERSWKEGPVARGEGEVLAKGLANADKWPVVHQALVCRLPRWVGSYGTDPLRWQHGKTVRESSDRKARALNNLASWQGVEAAYSRKISQHFRPEEDDWLPEGAFAIISYIERAPFAEALVTWAVTRAIMEHDTGVEQFAWLLRLNGEDHEATEAEILREAAALQRLADPVAIRAADLLLEALATPNAMTATSVTCAGSRPAAKKTSLQLDASGIITWPDPDAARGLSATEWLQCLAFFAPDPQAELSDDDRRRLDGIAAELTRDSSATGVVFEREAVSLALSRWAPDALAQLIRREVANLTNGTSVARVDPAQRIEELVLILHAQERETLLRDGLKCLGGSVPSSDEKQGPAVLRVKNLIAAGLIGKPTSEQINTLMALRQPFAFSRALARWMGPLEAADTDNILDALVAEKDEKLIACWLDYIGLAGVRGIPTKGSVLVDLSKSESKAVRGEAIALIWAAKCDELSKAFVDSGWTHERGQERLEALLGTYILCKSGTHLTLDELRRRIIPQALPYLVQARGCVETELTAAYGYVEELLDEEISGKRTARYGYPHIFDAKDAWQRIVRMNNGALVEKTRQAVEDKGDLGFFNIFPLVELVEAILEVSPSEGVDIWSSVKTAQRRDALSMGDFDNLAFSRSSHAELAKLRQQMLDMAKNDADLAEIVLMGLRNDHETWLINVIKGDIDHASAGRIARGLALAGLLDCTKAADRLWHELVEAREFRGWLAEVRGNARSAYKHNRDARHWLEQYLATTDVDHAFGYLKLFTERADGRSHLWILPIVNRRRKHVARSWLQQLDAFAEDQKDRWRKTKAERKQLLCSTRISACSSPWL